MSSYFRPLRVQWLACLQDTIGQMHEFAHHGTDATHLALAALSQALGPCLKELTASDGSNGREVERSPQSSIADL